MKWKLDKYKIEEEARFDNVIALKIEVEKIIYRFNYTIKDNNIYNENNKKVLDLDGNIFGKISDFLN